MMKRKTFIKIMVPMLIIVFLAAAAVAETGKEDTGFIVKKSTQLKADKTVSEATLSPLPGVFATAFSPEELSRMPGNPKTYAEATNPPAGLSSVELVALNEKIMLWRKPYTAEELSRMPGEAKTYAEAANPPAGLSSVELVALNEKIMLWRKPYTAEELSRMPGEPKTYAEATNPGR
ncbi:hypothetical protein ACFL5Y_03375 [Candidatus Omnitrophota bacterium]